MKSTNIIRVHRPKLTPEERARRMEAIKQAAVNLVIATERKKGSQKWTDKQNGASAL